jgi:hypothetical protein
MVEPFVYIPPGPDTVGPTWRERRVRSSWKERERTLRGSSLHAENSPPKKLLTPRGWDWDTYIKYDFEKSSVTQFVVPQPLQKPLTRVSKPPWVARDQLVQGRPRMSQFEIHRSLASPRPRTSVAEFSSLSPRSPMGFSTTPRPFPRFANE